MDLPISHYKFTCVRTIIPSIVLVTFQMFDDMETRLAKLWLLPHGGHGNHKG